MTRINDSAARVRARWISPVRLTLVAALFVAGYASNALAAGSISGQVTDSVTHVGVAGAKVAFFDVNANDDFPVATAITDGSGNYLQNLPAGSYGVVAGSSATSPGYISEAWNGISCSATCDVNSITPVVVAGSAVTSINFALVAGGGRISGTITSSVTGLPIANAIVVFVDSNGNVPFTFATTDGSGHYISDGGSVAGNVLVFTANGQGYQDEVYNNCKLATCSTPNPVAVTLGVTTSGIDLALDPGGRISGTVKDINNVPLANVSVRTYDPTGNRVDDVVTDASGNFITNGLAGGTFYVSTRNSAGLVDYTWNGLLCVHDFCDERQGTPIAVTVGSTTGNINLVLPPGQTISGTVTAAAGGAPIADVFVGLMNSSGAFIGGANTNASGAFTTGAVPPGTYYANVSANGFVVQLYNHLNCSNGQCSFTVSTPITVTSSAVTNINFSLIATGTGTITGTVIDGFSALALNGVSVQLFTLSGGTS